MNTVTNELSGCPSGHVWCENPHPEPIDPPNRHWRTEILVIGASTLEIELVLDDHDEDADPKVVFEIYEWTIAFGEMSSEIGDMHRFADAIAARLTWFTIGVEALRAFTYSVDIGSDGLVMHQWELPATGVQNRAHYIDFDAEAGFRISPWSPDEVMPPDEYDAWNTDIATLRVASAFLAEVAPR